MTRRTRRGVNVPQEDTVSGSVWLTLSGVGVVVALISLIFLVRRARRPPPDASDEERQQVRKRLERMEAWRAVRAVRHGRAATSWRPQGPGTSRTGRRRSSGPRASRWTRPTARPAGARRPGRPGTGTPRPP